MFCKTNPDSTEHFIIFEKNKNNDLNIDMLNGDSSDVFKNSSVIFF